MPVGAIPEEDRVTAMLSNVVNDQMHAAWVCLQAAIHAKVAGIQDAIGLTAPAELVLWLSQIVGSLTLPTVGLIPLAP